MTKSIHREFLLRTNAAVFNIDELANQLGYQSITLYELEEGLNALLFSETTDEFLPPIDHVLNRVWQRLHN